MCDIIKAYIIEYGGEITILLTCTIYYTNYVHIWALLLRISYITQKVEYGIRKRRNLLRFIILGSTLLMIKTMS